MVNREGDLGWDASHLGNDIEHGQVERVQLVEGAVRMV